MKNNMEVKLELNDIKKIEIKDGVTPEEYLWLRKQVGWSGFPLEEAEISLKNSYQVICARDGGKAVGFLRLVWDGGYTAFLSDLIVIPEYQGKGIGRKLIETSIERLKNDLKPGFSVKYELMAALHKDTFYEKFGFISYPSEEHGPGMTMKIVKEEA